MEARVYGCGCHVTKSRAGETLRDVCCSRHAPVGRAVTLLSRLALDLPLWAALERVPDSDVRERAHEHYYQVERCLGQLEGNLSLERESSQSGLVPAGDCLS